MERKNFDWLWVISVYLLSLNLFGIPNYLMIGVFFVGFVVALYKNSFLKINMEIIIIFLFSILYYTTLLYHGDAEGVGKLITFLFGPTAMYLIGYSIIKTSNKIMINTILAVVFGNFTHGLLNLIRYVQINGFVNNIIGSRVLPDIWTRTEMTATLQGTLYTLISSLLFYSVILFIKKEKRLLAMTIIGATVIAIIATFTMGNRTLLVIVSLTFIMSFMLYSLLSIRNIEKVLRANGLVFAFLLFLIFIYSQNLFGIKVFIEGSTLFTRTSSISILEDTRWSVYLKVISQIPLHPFGGYKMNLGGLSFAHNLWLDVLNAAGLIPFILLIIFTFMNLKNLYRIIISNKVELNFKIIIFSISIGFLLNFMVEPILEGVPFMFLSYCLINGMIKKKNDLINTEVKGIINEDIVGN